MKEMAKLKDHVNYQLDLRAPFAFMPFNQITQAPAGSPLISAISGDPASNPAPYPFVQVDPGCGTPVWGEPALSSLHCTKEGTSGPAPRRPTHDDLFQDPRASAGPSNQPGRPNKAREEAVQAPGEDQDIHFVQEQGAGGPEYGTPSPDHVEPGGPEAPPGSGGPRGNESHQKGGGEPQPGKAGPGGAA